MARYDWDRGYMQGPGRGRYANEFDPWTGSGPRDRPPMRRERPFDRYEGYDRGFQGMDYPGYDGYPGGRFSGDDRWGPSGRAGGSGGWQRPEYFDDRPPRRDRDDWRGGPGAPWERMSGGGDRYDDGYAHSPFMPESAYRSHPEYDRPPRHIRDRWPGEPMGGQGGYELMGDDEMLQAVRQSLFQDNWVDAERIEVAVEDGVVTLKGEVDDFLEARYAWDDAWETPGVRGVVNHIHVRVDGPAGEHDSMVQTTTGGTKGKPKRSGG
jgi:hypothetical protein